MIKRKRYYFIASLFQRLEACRNIFYGKRNFFNWRRQKEKDDKNKDQEKYLGIVPKKWGKKILWVGGIGIILLIIIFFFQKIYKEINCNHDWFFTEINYYFDYFGGNNIFGSKWNELHASWLLNCTNSWKY